MYFGCAYVQYKHLVYVCVFVMYTFGVCVCVMNTSGIQVL